MIFPQVYTSGEQKSVNISLYYHPKEELETILQSHLFEKYFMSLNSAFDGHAGKMSQLVRFLLYNHEHILLVKWLKGDEV